MRPVRIALALALAALAIPLGAPQARACTCGPSDPRTDLQRADAAAVVIAEGPPTEPQGSEPRQRVRVREAVKGDLPETMDLVLGGHGTSCAFSLAVGHEYGLFLSQEGSGWRAGLCSQVDPATLRRAAQPLPAPDGAGPPRLILAGGFGEARTIALDRELRTVAYGLGSGEALRVAVCPGARYALEFVQTADEPPRYVLGVRRLPSFSLEREISLIGVVKPGEYPAVVRSLRCRDPSGREAVVFLSMGRPHDVLGRVLVLTASRQHQTWEGRAHFGVFSEDGRHAFAVDPDRKLIEIDLATSAVREIRTVREEPDDEMRLSPDGKTLAWFGATHVMEGVLCVIDVEDGTQRVRDAQSGSGRVTWTPDARIVFASGSGDVQRVEILTAELAPVTTWEGWEWTGGMIAAGDRLFGFGYGSLRVASLLDGSKRIDRHLDSPLLNDLVGVPAPPPEPTPAPTTAATPAPTVEALPTAVPAPLASSRAPWAAAGLGLLSVLTLVVITLRTTRRTG